MKVEAGFVFSAELANPAGLAGETAKKLVSGKIAIVP
jgi:hypothetical protein